MSPNGDTITVNGKNADGIDFVLTTDKGKQVSFASWEGWVPYGADAWTPFPHTYIGNDVTNDSIWLVVHESVHIGQHIGNWA